MSMETKWKMEDLYDSIKGFMRENNIENRDDLEIWIDNYNVFPFVDDLCEIIGYPKERE